MTLNVSQSQGPNMCLWLQTMKVCIALLFAGPFKDLSASILANQVSSGIQNYTNLSQVKLNRTPVFVFCRFHLAASRGHLDCLNIMLGHHVDVTAADATGMFTEGIL